MTSWGNSDVFSCSNRGKSTARTEELKLLVLDNDDDDDDGEVREPAIGGGLRHLSNGSFGTTTTVMTSATTATTVTT